MARKEECATARESTTRFKFFFPIIVLIAFVVSAFTYKPVWFWLHIFSMILAFIVLAPLGLLIKKIGGKENTKRHGYLLGGSMLFACFGLYVIYTNKITLGKEHFKTTHGKLGLFTVIGM